MEDIFDKLNVPIERRSEEYRKVLTEGCLIDNNYLYYGAATMQANELELQRLQKSMSPEAFALAMRMAEEDWDE